MVSLIYGLAMLDRVSCLIRYISRDLKEVKSGILGIQDKLSGKEKLHKSPVLISRLQCLPAKSLRI